MGLEDALGKFRMSSQVAEHVVLRSTYLCTRVVHFERTFGLFDGC